MNKIGAQPNGPGPSMADQAAFVNGRGTRLIGAADTLSLLNPAAIAAQRRFERELVHLENVLQTCQRLGKVIGTAAR